MTEAHRQELAKQRRALVARTLADILDTPQLERAMQIWDRRFSRTEDVAVIDYVGQITSELALEPRERHRIRVDLYRTLRESNDPHITFYRNEAEQDSAPAPTAATSSVPVRHSGIPQWEDDDINSMFVAEADLPQPPEVAAPVSASPAWIIFVVILTHILEGVKLEGAEAATEFAFSIQKQRKSLKVNEHMHQILVVWARGEGSLDALAGASEKDWSRMVHGVYVATAEAVGPVAADRLLTRSISAAQTLPEARMFEPRRFL